MHRDTSNASNNTTDAPTNTTTSATSVITRSTDTCIYGVGIVAVQTRAACMFFTYNKKYFYTSNKEQAKD